MPIELLEKDYSVLVLLIESENTMEFSRVRCYSVLRY